MKEQLITFETAKLAKEKGFNGKSYFYWMLNEPDKLKKAFNKKSPWDFNFESEYKTPSESITAPTQSLLQKWLRDIHNIDVWSQPFVRKQSLPDESYSYFLFKDGVWMNDGVNFIDFEEALEKGLQEALKLIP
jgi:hypothetical protein